MVVIHEIRQIIFAFYSPLISSQQQFPPVILSYHPPCLSPVVNVVMPPGQLLKDHVILTLELATFSSCSLFLTASSNN